MKDKLCHVTGFLCGPRIYQYDGWYFENHFYCGPWPLKKNGDPRKRAGRVFFKMFDRFSKLDKEEQQKHCLGGGCVAF